MVRSLISSQSLRQFGPTLNNSKKPTSLINNRRYFYSHRDIVITVIFLDIYIDVLIVVNAYICWLMLSSVSFIANIYIRPRLKVIATLLGGLSSLIILTSSETALQSLLAFALKLISLLAVIFISFYKQPVKKIAVAGLLYIGLNLLLGGAVYLTKPLFGDSVIYSNNGVLYFNISLTQLIVTTAFIYLLLVLSSRLYYRFCDKNHSYKVEFSVGDSEYCISAIADTGNLAKDVFTGKPVIICTGISLYSDISDALPIPVPYNTISGEGILYAIKPNRICIIDEKNSRLEVDALVAGIESISGERRAIFNPNIL